jgi:ferredoxin
MHTDKHLLSMLEKYDGWVKEGKIPYAGKILPIPEAYRSQPWILPTQQAIEILGNARTIALAECSCRKYYRRCSHPLETCLLVNNIADTWVETGLAPKISMKQVGEVLKIANKDGLVHQATFNPEQQIWAVCSCCPCCCYRLQILLQHGRVDLVAHSDYIVIQEYNLCNNCGLCAPRCIFGARHMDNKILIYQNERCFGCGLCVTACPEQAVTLQLRNMGLPGQ